MSVMLPTKHFSSVMGRPRDGDGGGGRVSYSRLYVCVYIGMKVFILTGCFIVFLNVQPLKH